MPEGKDLLLKQVWLSLPALKSLLDGEGLLNSLLLIHPGKEQTETGQVRTMKESCSCALSPISELFSTSIAEDCVVFGLFQSELPAT